MPLSASFHFFSPFHFKKKYHKKLFFSHSIIFFFSLPTLLFSLSFPSFAILVILLLLQYKYNKHLGNFMVDCHSYINILYKKLYCYEEMFSGII